MGLMDTERKRISPNAATLVRGGRLVLLGAFAALLWFAATAVDGFAAVPGAGFDGSTAAPRAGSAGPAAAGPAVTGRRASTSARKSAKSKRRPRGAIVSVKQGEMIHRGRIRVRVRSPRRGRVSVYVISSTYDSPNTRRFTFTKRPRFRSRRKPRVIQLRLRPDARAAVKSCEARDLRVVAAGRRGKPRALNRTTPPCSPKPIDLSRAETCDFIDGSPLSSCMSPFPNDFYTLADQTTGSGRRINFSREAMPFNAAGQQVDPTPFNAADGFSPGQGIVVRVPGLETQEAFDASGLSGLEDPAAYLDPESPVVVFETSTRKRHPVWAELDYAGGLPGEATLNIHPLVNFEPGTRYIVALRGLRDSSGQPLPAPEGFRYYRDWLPSTSPFINRRRTHFENIFRRLANNGVPRSDLYLAWDFTVASDASNVDRSLSMRNQAFQELGDANLADRSIPAASTAPAFSVDPIASDPAPGIDRLVTGTFAVPCFLTLPDGAGDCGPGSRLKLDEDGMPVKTGMWNASFRCIVPESAVDGPSPEPARPLLIAHEPMGGISTSILDDATVELAVRHGFVSCGTDLIGMAAGDELQVTRAFRDISHLPAVADRLQQALLDQLFLARLMIHPDGFSAHPAFRIDPDLPAGDPVIDPDERVSYRGSGLGGVTGGALVALSPDIDRAALAGGAMNLSVILPRSAGWPLYNANLEPAYPGASGPLALGLAQMLFDRAEANGYGNRMTYRPLENTHTHSVLIDAAFGDHLVTNWQSNAMARTIGAQALNPWVGPGRWQDVDAAWGIDSIGSYPSPGSGIAYFDSGPLRPDPLNPLLTIGTDPPPTARIAPASGLDPHGDPPLSVDNQEMVSAFLGSDGRLTNPCTPSACFSGGWTGP